MRSEYEFATHHLPGLRGKYRFFFYENQLPYEALNDILNESPPPEPGRTPTYILGNSAAPELNHLDAVASMQAQNVRANLLVPVSYGNDRYRRFLKNNLSLFTGGKVEFIDRYMSTEEYLHFLYQADGLIMNNIRPQGYGNIFMMMYLGKKVYLNERNLSIPDLNERQLGWLPLKDLGQCSVIDADANRAAVLRLLSHEALLKVYADLFS